MKNKILKGITGLAITAFFTSASFADTYSIIPVLVLFGSLVWLLLFSLANFEGGRNEKKM